MTNISQAEPSVLHHEIERKFLIKGDFMPEVFNTTHICQGYISTNKNGTVRVRIRDDKGYLTIKGKSLDHGCSRLEWEKEIPLEEAQQLMQLCGHNIIDKERHLVHAADGVHIFEVDVFHGLNEGLVMAEVELGSPEEVFSHPEWLGEEVTGDRRYYNSQLIINPFSQWSLNGSSE